MTLQSVQSSNPAEALDSVPQDTIVGVSEEHDVESNSLSIVGQRWPHLIVGTLLAMGIFGATTDPADHFKWLIWLPPAVLVGWVALNVIFGPKKPTAEKPFAYDDEWDAAEDARLSTKTVSPTAADGGDKVPAAPAATAGDAGIASADVSFGDYKGVVVVWGSETGTAEGLANATVTRLSEAGIDAKSIDAGKVTLASLQGVQRLLLLTSTWGDGEPPSNAEALWNEIQKGKADLKSMQFSICALGDTGYPQFCQCGKDFDNFLAKHGATRMAPRVDCDLDYEGPYETWINAVIPALKANPIPA